MDSKYIVDVLRIYSTKPDEDQKNPLMQDMPITEEMADKFSFALTHEGEEGRKTKARRGRGALGRHYTTLAKSEVREAARSPFFFARC